MELMLPLYGIPSTTYRGARLPFTEPNPRMRTVAELPGCPDVLITDTPATSPAKALETFETFLLFKASPFTAFADPVKASLVDTLYPTTTTSSNEVFVNFNVALIEVSEPILTSCGSMLTEENTRIFAFSETLKEYVPSDFVIVPTDVPLTTTEALTTGSTLSSVTFPVIVRCCAQRWLMERLIANSSITT